MNYETSLSSLIWSSADDVLRGLFKPSEYGRVILPFVVMRRLDCVLEPKKDEVYELYTRYKVQLSDPTPVILRQIGFPFFNSSKFDLSRIKSDPNNVLMNFNNYVQGYSKNVLDIIENFSINPLVEKLHKNKRLYLLIDKFTEFDLHPDKIDNHQMGSVYEELLRKFSEMSNEESGDHFTPRDVVKLLVSFVFGGDRKDLQGEGKIRSVFDPCCGTGGMLTIGKEWIHENINSNLKVDLYGQELNDVTYSICKSDLLMMDENPENIHGPCSSLSDDRLKGRKFDYMITNPPFGVSWKSEAEHVYEEAKDPDGRFSVGVPKVSDGSFLFVLHLISKMNKQGSRIGVILNGSPLFNGDAGSGESEIRRYLLENDFIESIVSLPDQLFFNTEIDTYLWIISNKKTKERRGKVQLIDGRGFFQNMKNPLGDKRKYISDEQIQSLFNVYESFKETEISKVLTADDFKYQKVPTKIVINNHWGKSTESSFEKVPFGVDVEDYFKKNVEPFCESYTYELKKAKVGYEIQLPKIFTKSGSSYNFDGLKAELTSLVQEINKAENELGLLDTFSKRSDTISTNIRWLDEIPASWRIVRSKFLFKNRSQKNNGDKPLLSVTQDQGVIARADLDYGVWNPGDDTSGYKLIKPGDYVISLRTFQGGIEYCEIEGIISPTYIPLIPREILNPKFMKYLLKSEDFIRELNTVVTGIRQGKTIPYDEFGDIYVCVPPIEEQEKIGNFFEKLEIYLELISSKEKVLQKIKSHLITTITTGRYEYV